jgi:hypothetical protein
VRLVGQLGTQVCQYYHLVPPLLTAVATIDLDDFTEDILMN